MDIFVFSVSLYQVFPYYMRYYPYLYYKADHWLFNNEYCTIYKLSLVMFDPAIINFVPFFMILQLFRAELLVPKRDQVLKIELNSQKSVKIF